MTKKTSLLILVIIVIAAAIYYLDGGLARRSFSGGGGVATTTATVLPAQVATSSPIDTKTVSNFLTPIQKAKKYSLAKEIVDPTGFINTPTGTKLQDFIGKKVILVDFWTYSCINCQRTLPYLTAWEAKYRDQGLVIIGVHTPEFDFEKVLSNVQMAVTKFGIKYPVILDSNYGTWKNYQNNYWPHEYLIDIDGYVVHDHIGEGGYDETEMIIKDLLKERAAKLGITAKIDDQISTPKAETVDASKPYSNETYFGSTRAGYPAGTLVGKWDISPEYATAGAGAKLVFPYQAAKVFMVAAADVPTTVEVYRDGQKIKTETIKANDLYRIVDDNIGYGKHTLELRFPTAGVKVFTLTFG